MEKFFYRYFVAATSCCRHCYHGVFTYNIFLFLAFSLPCGKFSGLICLICGFAPQSAAMVMLGSFLLLWDLSPTWLFVSQVQYEQVNVEEIGDGPFTLAWRSMHFLSVLQILCSFTPT